MNKKILKLMVSILAIAIFIPIGVSAGVTDSQIIRKTTTNYFTTVKLKGSFYNEWTGETLEFNREAQETAGNVEVEAVANIINGFKEEFNTWAESNGATKKETKSEQVENYYYDAHDEITQCDEIDQDNNCVVPSTQINSVNDLDNYDAQGVVIINTILDKHQEYVVTMKATKEDKRIKTVDVTVELPRIGDEITIEDNDWDTQRPQASITLPSGVKYELDGSDDMNYMYYIDTTDNQHKPFKGAFEKGKTYTMEIWFKAIDEFYFTSDTKVTINGKEVSIDDLDDSQISVLYEFTPRDKEYKILDGANQTVNKNSKNGLTVRADGPINEFVELRVDGNVVSEKDYVKKEGSTIVTLNSSYLKTLSNGTHTLTFVYTNGTVSTTFNVTNINNPQTGDNILNYMILFGLSLVGLTSVKTLKKKNN